MGSAVGSASRQVPARFSRDDPNPGDLNKSHALRGSKSGMPDPRRKQKLQALQQKKEVARLAAVKFEDNWLEVLEDLGRILSAEHIWRIYLLLEGASKSEGLAGELNHAANIHHANRRLDLEEPKLCSASKQRVAIEERLHALLKLDETYHSISDIYNSTKKSYAEILEEGLGSRDLVRQVLDKSGMANQLKETAAARVGVIKTIERFRDLLREERTRLMNKLDELPLTAPDKTTARAASSRQLSKRPPKSAAPSKPQKPVSSTPTNRVNFNAQADDNPKTVLTLTGKPRSENAGIIDILNSRGQRTATYIRSPNQQLFLKYSPPDRASGAKTGASKVSLSELSEQMKNMLLEVAEGEKMADYIRSQSWSSPRSAYDLLEYQANKLRTFAAEVEESKQGLPTAADRESAGNMAQTLETRAADLVKKGQSTRIERILRAPPTPEHLMYLSDLGLLGITQTVSRRPGKRMVFDPVTNSQSRQTDFLDEFEITVSGQPWAYAHMHYPAADTPAESFARAHLKKINQRGTTGEGTHYGTFYRALFKKIFL